MIWKCLSDLVRLVKFDLALSVLVNCSVGVLDSENFCFFKSWIHVFSSMNSVYFFLGSDVT